MIAAISAFDAGAADFERRRAVPEEVAQSVRDAVLQAFDHIDRPRLLDLGAGSGRFGWPFVAAGDDYVGVDLSAGMLRIFAGRDLGGRRPTLVQADGGALPFPVGSFDAVLLIAVFGDLPNWRSLVDEACRVLRPGGAVVLGRVLVPDNGIDECMKACLDRLVDERPAGPVKQGGNRRADAARYLAARAWDVSERSVAHWTVERTPRAFLERHRGGVRFSRLPQAARKDALRALAAWAETEFGTLDAGFAETHRFAMQLFRFAEK
jgi:ubiquinone/menaquinone biosynthesis C-methylase UbiE